MHGGWGAVSKLGYGKHMSGEDKWVSSLSCQRIILGRLANGSYLVLVVLVFVIQ